jgi:hypothetical protein
MIAYPAISSLTGDRHAPEQVIGMAGLGDRHHPDSLIDFTGIRSHRNPCLWIIRVRIFAGGYELLVTVQLIIVTAVRWAHNPEVAGSSPAPATEKRHLEGVFFA